METVACISLKNGMILAENVYGTNNQLLAEEGQTITAEIIARFKKYNIMCVNVKDALDLATTHFARIQADPAFKHFCSVYDPCLKYYKDAIQHLIKSGTPIDLTVLMHIYIRVSQCVKTPEQLLDFLYNKTPNPEDLTYVHCMNSALISGIFATWAGFTSDEKRLVILSGFLYDIGKFLLPEGLIWKNGKLTDLEFTQMKSHTILAFQLLDKQKLPKEILDVTLTHHEKCDGSGYPSKLKSHQISKYAKIIAIVDAYDAMASIRPYRSSLHAFEIISRLEKDGYAKFDPSYLLPILQHVAEAQLHMRVRLADGREGIVTYINPSDLSRPSLRDDEGHMINLILEQNAQIDILL